MKKIIEYFVVLSVHYFEPKILIKGLTNFEKNCYVTILLFFLYSI